MDVTEMDTNDIWFGKGKKNSLINTKMTIMTQIAYRSIW
jgi:hypothetical protein